MRLNLFDPDKKTLVSNGVRKHNKSVEFICKTKKKEGQTEVRKRGERRQNIVRKPVRLLFTQ